MNLQEAIVVAIDFEKKVRDHYLRGAKDIPEPMGRKVFATLGKEEQGHVEYLEHCLAEWKKSGKVPNVPLKTILPKGARWIDAERSKLAGKGKRVASKTELEALKVALQHEKDADTFYHKLVRELPAQDRPLFDKFLGIEDGHLALVQAQLDSVQGMGFWFDVAEFRLEAE
ncbi:MAG TPA: ferritin family protein [Anaeromyxobacter sp.]|nr:ferritin family protein [Anaeromyxobacter sp.]